MTSNHPVGIEDGKMVEVCSSLLGIGAVGVKRIRQYSPCRDKQLQAEDRMNKPALQATRTNQKNARGIWQRGRGLTCVAEIRRAKPGFKSNSVTGEALQCRRVTYAYRCLGRRIYEYWTTMATSKCFRTTAWLLSNSACPGDLSAAVDTVPATKDIRCGALYKPSSTPCATLRSCGLTGCSCSCICMNQHADKKR